MKTRKESAKKIPRRWWLAIGILTILFVATIGTLQYRKYSAFEYNGLDLGIYTQVVWSIGHGHGFASSIHDPSYLGDHVELWLVPLAGLYRLWSNPLLLLWAQALIIAGSVWPLVLIARRILGIHSVIPVAALWLVHPLIYNPAMYEFHGLVFALPILCWSIWWYLEKRYVWWLLSLVALAAVREDMPLIIAGWAALSLVDRRSWRWWLIPGLLATVWFTGAQAIIRQAGWQGTYKYLAFYHWLGNTPGEMLTFPFRHPLVFLSRVLSPYNWQTVVSFLVSFGLLPLWGRRVLIPVSLSFAQLLLLGAEADSILRLHYVIPFLPFLAWAAFVGWDELRRGRVLPRLDRSLVLTCAVIVAVAGPLYAHIIFGAAEFPWTPRPDIGWTEPKILRSFVAQIRPDDRIITTFNLLPSLASRPTIYSLNYLYLGRRQYTETPYTIPSGVDVALIDWQQYYHYQYIYKTTEFQGLTGSERIEQFLQDNNLHLVRWIDSVALYRRDGRDSYQPTTSVPGFELSSKPLLLTDSHVSHANPIVPGFQQIPLTLTWWLGEKLPDPLSIRFTLIDHGRLVTTSTRLLGQGTKPSFEWGPGQYWTTKYRLAVPVSLHGSFDVTAEVVAFTGRMRLDRWRAFTPVLSGHRVLQTLDLGSVQL